MSNILIAVPCYRNNVSSGTAGFLTTLGVRLTQLGHQSTLSFKDMFDIVRVRNFFGSRMLETNYSHLLFVDDDISVRAEAVIRMLQANKPLIGVAYPARAINLDVFASERGRGIGRDTAMTNALEWTFEPDDDRTCLNGLAKAKRIGTGIMLVAREVFEAIKEKDTSLRKSDAENRAYKLGLKGPLYGFFDVMLEPAYFSEDYAFCERWRAVGGEIHMLADEVARHVGQFTYQGKLSDGF